MSLLEKYEAESVLEEFECRCFRRDVADALSKIIKDSGLGITVVHCVGCESYFLSTEIECPDCGAEYCTDLSVGSVIRLPPPDPNRGETWNVNDPATITSLEKIDGVRYYMVVRNNKTWIIDSSRVTV